MRTAKQRSEPDNGPRISEEKKSIKRYPLMVISSVATVQVTACMSQNNISLKFTMWIAVDVIKQDFVYQQNVV